MTTKGNLGWCQRNRFSLLAGALVLATGALGHAAQYKVETLGTTLQSYSEHRMGINVANDVAWSEKVGTTFQARVSTGGASPAKLDLHALAGGPARSYAEDLNDAKHAVGYTTTSARETFSSAALWVWSTATLSHTYVNLGAAAATQLNGNPVETSAAYAISPVKGGVFYVAGYAREVAGGTGATPSQPVVWTVNASTGAVTGMQVLALGPYAGGYGVAYGVTEDGVAVGAAAPIGGYLTAVVWKSLGHSANTVPELMPGTNVGDPISSVANRVRRVNLNGNLEDVVVGHSFRMPSTGDLQGDVEGFVYRLDESAIDRSFSLGGRKNGLMDVGLKTFGAGKVGETSGLWPVGFSVNDGVIFANQALGAKATDGAHRVEIGAHANTCDINDALPTAGFSAIRFAQAINSLGSLAGWRADGLAVRAIALPKVGDLALQIRDTPALPGQALRSEFWVNYSGGANLQEVVLAQSAGCAALAASCGDGRLDLSDTDLQNEALRILRDPGTSNVSFQTPLSAITPGNAHPATKFGWMQAINDASVDCGMTPVVPIDEALNPAGADAWGGFWCDRNATPGSETNIRENLNACGAGACPSAAAIPSYTCATRECNNGVPNQDIDAGACLIGAACYVDTQINPTAANQIPLQLNGSCSNTNVANPCNRCLSDTSQTSWTGLKPADTICCDSGSKPVLDPYDQIGNRHDSYKNSPWTCGEDGNHGQNVGGWWVDERNLTTGRAWDNWQSYYQGSLWSSAGVCNLHSSATEPQVLPRGHNATTAGHVRRIRGHFTPGIDTADWYGTVFDDNPGGAVTFKPRGRLRSHGTHPTETNRKVRLQMCIYIDSINRGRGDVDIEKVHFRAGRGKFYTANSIGAAVHYLPLVGLNDLRNKDGNAQWLFDYKPDWAWTTAYWAAPPRSGSTATTYYYHNYADQASASGPAGDGKGPCFQTDDNGVLDYSFSSYLARNTDEDEAWVYYAVSLVDTDLNGAMCDDIKYSLFYGNDRDSSGSFNWNATGSGCATCCDEGPW